MARLIIQCGEDWVLWEPLRKSLDPASGPWEGFPEAVAAPLGVGFHRVEGVGREKGVCRERS